MTATPTSNATHNNKTLTVLCGILSAGIFLTSYLSYADGLEHGAKKTAYTCPTYAGKELISSALLLDDLGTPISVTCSYVPSAAAYSYGKAVSKQVLNLRKPAKDSQ